MNQDVDQDVEQDTPTPIPEQTFELLRRARGGDGDALTGLYQRFAPRVRGLAALRMGRTLLDLVDCDDVVQEAMATALQRLDQFANRSEGAFVCWLAAIVESRLQNAVRAANAGKRGGGHVVRRADLGVTTLAGLVGANQGASPSQALAAGELDAQLERALLALGTPQRQIVYCRLVLEMSFAEIAADLGLAGADSTRAMFHKALLKLRERLGPPPDSGS